MNTKKRSKLDFELEKTRKIVAESGIPPADFFAVVLLETIKKALNFKNGEKE